VKVVTTPKAEAFIRERGGRVWVWLDPRRGLVGSYVWLEAHCEPPGSSRKSRFTRSSRRRHRFSVTTDAGVEVHHDFGRLDPPEELHLDVKGWRKGSQRLEAYWNGVIFVGEDIEPPAVRDAFETPAARSKRERKKER
jgi:hypothetical protein